MTEKQELIIKLMEQHAEIVKCALLVPGKSVSTIIPESVFDYTSMFMKSLAALLKGS